MTIHVRMHPVDFVIRRHQRPGFSFPDSNFEGSKVKLPERSLIDPDIHVHAVCFFLVCCLLSAAGACHTLRVLDQAELNSRQCPSDLGATEYCESKPSAHTECLICLWIGYRKTGHFVICYSNSKSNLEVKMPDLSM